MKTIENLSLKRRISYRISVPGKVLDCDSNFSYQKVPTFELQGSFVIGYNFLRNKMPKNKHLKCKTTFCVEKNFFCNSVVKLVTLPVILACLLSYTKNKSFET